MTRLAWPLVALAAALSIGSFLPRTARAEGSTPCRTQIDASDDVGRFTVAIENGRIVLVRIGDEIVPSDRIRQADGKGSVEDENGSVVLELEFSPKGEIRWQRRAERVTVGLTIGDVDDALASHLAIEPAGAILVTDVAAGGPAETAGVERFDVITAVDERSPATREALQEAVAGKRPGEALVLEVRRGGARRSISVDVESEAVVKRQGVPILGDIPLIGFLYSRQGERADAVDPRWLRAASTSDSGDPRLRAIEDRLARIEALLQSR